MTIYHLLLIFCWAVFVLVWGISSLSSGSATSFWRAILIRLVLAAVILALFGRSIVTNPANYHLVSPSNAAVSILGVALCAIGVAFAVWARFALGRNWAMPRTVKENPELVTSGPYAYVRHPIYTGVITALLGTSLVVGWVWLAIFVVAGFYFAYSATVEEKTMLKNFPDTFPAYKKRTKMLIPFVF